MLGCTDECGLLLWSEVEGNGVSTHLIWIMFQRAIVTHVSHSIQIRVSLVHVVHVGAVVLLIQNACGDSSVNM